MKEKVENVLFGVAVIAMMGFISFKMTDQFEPSKVFQTNRPVYTPESYQLMERELAQKSFRLERAENILNQISNPKGLIQ